jgi:hypothetical protein
LYTQKTSEAAPPSPSSPPLKGGEIVVEHPFKGGEKRKNDPPHPLTGGLAEANRRESEKLPQSSQKNLRDKLLDVSCYK